MFTDPRKKKILFIAHCIQNQNSISDGTAVYPGSIEEIMTMLLKQDVGIVQMPCPELMCLGLDRGNSHGGQSSAVVENTRIRRMMMTVPAREKLRQLVHQIVFQIQEYRKHQFNIMGILGVNRSPSCGVDTTSKENREVDGKGLFMEALDQELKMHQTVIPIMGIRALETTEAQQTIKKLLA